MMERTTMMRYETMPKMAEKVPLEGFFGKSEAGFGFLMVSTTDLMLFG